MIADLDALEQLLAKATPGPWRSFEDRLYFARQLGGFSLANCPQSTENVAVIADLRNAAPAMIAELRALWEYYEADQRCDYDALYEARAKVEALKEK